VNVSGTRKGTGRPQPVGLVNEGANCFLNALMQNLRNVQDSLRLPKTTAEVKKADPTLRAQDASSIACMNTIVDRALRSMHRARRGHRHLCNVVPKFRQALVSVGLDPAKQQDPADLIPHLGPVGRVSITYTTT
jgi:ubiquitin C-terminal hydrolase